MLPSSHRKQTIGKSTRNYIEGDSVTSYPTLSHTTVDLVDQNPGVRCRVSGKGLVFVAFAY